ncbi:hypothetical protein KUV89_03630 [Marinobacter hydrocarbonoclasticus]|nr:hypothetical protein [Marinobacter nauticus]
MMMPELFLLSCLAMGAGIGADVALASASTTGLPRRARWLWLAGVTATHTLFPMAGYLLTFFSARAAPALLPWLGLLAAGLILHFYLDEVRNTENAQENPGKLSWPLLLAISWDALWSGPAKSAQVLEWSPLWVWLSFLVVGAVVLGCALLGQQLGRWLMSHPAYAGGCRYLQLTILGYFGLLALCRYTLHWPVPELFLFALSALITALARLPRPAPQLQRDP